MNTENLVLSRNNQERQETTIGKEKERTNIPLIKEQPQEFFSWEDLKRKQVAQTKEFEDTAEEIAPIKNQVVMDE